MFYVEGSWLVGFRKQNSGQHFVYEEGFGLCCYIYPSELLKRQFFNILLGSCLPIVPRFMKSDCTRIIKTILDELKPTIILFTRLKMNNTCDWRYFEV